MQPCKEASLIHTSADTLLRHVDALCFLFDSGNHPKQNRQKQAEPGTDLAEQVHHLVRGKHRIHAGKPNANPRNAYTQHNAVHQRFQGHIVTHKVLLQYCHAEMGIGTVIQCKRCN